MKALKDFILVFLLGLCALCWASYDDGYTDAELSNQVLDQEISQAQLDKREAKADDIYSAHKATGNE